MKKYFLLLLTLISIKSFAWEKVVGSGNLKTETRTVSAFKGLQVSGSASVVMKYGSSNEITVEADDNLLPYIETTIEGNTLRVGTRKNTELRTKNKMTVTLMMTAVELLSVSGSGNINGSGNFSNDAETKVSLSGSGNINVSAADFASLDISISGSGNIVLKANKTNKMNASISGSGNIDCQEIMSQEVKASIAGSGSIKCHAVAVLDARIAGSGSIYYKGEPSNKTTKKSGSGSFIKMS